MGGTFRAPYLGTIGIGGRGGVPGALSAAADAPGVAPAVVTPGFRGTRRVVPGAVIPGVRGGQGGSNKSNNAPTILDRFTELWWLVRHPTASTFRTLRSF